MHEQRSDDRESVSRAKNLLLQEVDALFSENPERVFEFANRTPKKGIFENWAVCRTQNDVLYRIDLKKELDEYGTLCDYRMLFKALSHDVLSSINNNLLEGFEILIRKNPIEPVYKKFKSYGSSVQFITGRKLLESHSVEMKVHELERFTEQIRASLLVFEEEASTIITEHAHTPSVKTLERMVRRVLKQEVEY
jgi:hypothetical protein